MTGDLSGFLAFGAALFLAVSHPPPPAGLRWWHRRWLFVLLLAATLGFFQRDAILANFQLWNPDESEMLAGALKLRHHPIFWRDVDGATHGPLNQFPLVLPALLGLRIDYLAAHLIGTAILVLTLYCLHRALAEWVSEGVARLCVLPGWAFFIFTREPEIVQYTTEMPSCLILAAAGWFGSRVWRTGAGVSAADLFRAGLLCGAAPFAKLQSTPMAAWVFGVAAFHLLRAPDRSGADGFETWVG